MTLKSWPENRAGKFEIVALATGSDRMDSNDRGADGF